MYTKQDIQNPSQMRLYNEDSRRLYLDADERRRFAQSAELQSPKIRAFCLTLLFTGCRLSEARALTSHSIQRDEGLIAVRSLKKRSQHHIRQIPVPQMLLDTLKSLEGEASEIPNKLLWEQDGKAVNRVTAYRWIKVVMKHAGIEGAHACPKGLRHSFGIHAVRSGVQLNMLQKWMGHTSISTTAIYTNAVGKEEREIAQKMWTEHD